MALATSQLLKTPLSQISEYLRYLGILACIANFVCLVLFISNATPLFIMAVVGVFSLFMPGKARLGWFAIAFAAYAAFLIGMDVFYFTDSSDFSANRRLALAYLSGIAMYYCCKETGAYFGSWLSLALATAFLGAALWHYGAWTDTFFVNGSLRFVGRFANSFGMVAALATLLGIVGLLRPSSAEPVFQSRPFAKFFAALYDKKLIALATLICSVLLLFSASRTCIYSCAIISAILVAFHVIGKKLPIRKVIVVLLLLMAASFALWQMAPDCAFKKNLHDRVMVTALKPWNASTIKTRKPIWDVSTAIAKENFLTGIGPQRFLKEVNARIQNNFDALAEIYDPHVLQKDTAIAAHPHNQFLALLVEYGVVGFGLFSFVFLFPVLYGIKRKTGFGAIVPVLGYFFIASFFEAPFYSNTASVGVAPSTFFYMFLGYFTCVHGAESK